MPKYINADESPTSRSNILDLLKLNLLNYQNMVESHGMKLGIQICLDEINKISSADVIEVVRCKDCKYGKVRQNYNGILPLCDKYCILHCAFMQSNDYCSYGERGESK